MEKQIFELEVAGRQMRYLLNEPAAANYFCIPLHHCGGEDFDIMVTEELRARKREFFPPEISEAFKEYKLLGYQTAKYLLRSQACIVHAVAIRWQGKAWLLCAPSGTGKTTQFSLWRRLRGREVRLLSGDQPIVTLESDGEVQTWASPWTGKERWVDDPGPAPLGGIIFLEQAAENSIEPLLSKESVPRLFQTFMAFPDTEEEIRGYAALADAMISLHPVWLLRNRGDFASARLAMGTIQMYLSERRQNNETV